MNNLVKNTLKENMHVFYFRVAGRVIRFNFTKDPSHCDNEGGRELQFLSFMDGNRVSVFQS